MVGAWLYMRGVSLDPDCISEYVSRAGTRGQKRDNVNPSAGMKKPRTGGAG